MFNSDGGNWGQIRKRNVGERSKNFMKEISNKGGRSKSMILT
jgi:hypothetical protein